MPNQILRVNTDRLLLGPTRLMNQGMGAKMFWFQVCQA